MRKVYGALLVALGLLLVLRLARGSSMLQLAGVLLVLAGLAVALLRHADDDPAAPAAEPAEEPAEEPALPTDPGPDVER